MTHPFVQKWQSINKKSTNHQNYPESIIMKNVSSYKKNRFEEVEFVVRQIEAHQLDLTTPYKYWIDLGFSFSNEFGEAGREFFHRISRFHPEYDFRKCDLQYDHCLCGRRSGRTIASFFYYAKQAGMEIPKINSQY
jgi:hypothetical protein